MPKDNIGPLKINSRYAAINSGTRGYLRYYELCEQISYFYLKQCVENISYKLLHAF